MSTAQRPLPVPTRATQPFWDAARQHRLLIQSCGECGKPQFYPRPFCRHCLSEKMEWKQSKGTGHIYTFTINHRAANAHMADKVPHAVAMISLDEGVRVMANVVDTPLEQIRIGARVAVRFLDLDGELSLPQFVLEESRR